LRRPLLSLVVIACSVSLMTSGRLTLRIVAPAMVYWSFIPLLEIASLAIVCRGRASELSFAGKVERFFRNDWPPLLWLLLFAAIWAFLPTRAVIPWWSQRWLEFLTAGVALAWSARLDYAFFRHDLKRTPRDALVQLLSQRLLSWIPAILIFVAPGAWQLLASELGL